MTEARARLSRACCVGDVEQRPSPQSGASIASADCTSTRTSPECTGSGNGSAGGRPGLNFAVDQQAPHVAVGHLADEVLDVDAAIAQRAAFLVRLGDLGLEGDDALEARLEVGHLFS